MKILTDLKRSSQVQDLLLNLTCLGGKKDPLHSTDYYSHFGEGTAGPNRRGRHWSRRHFGRN